MPFVFDAVELYVVTINEKPWTRAREVCRALEYGKSTKAADIVKHLCSRENYVHKYQLNKLVLEMNFMDWSKDSRKDDQYVYEEGMYEMVFSSQQLKTRHFSRLYCNVLFLHFRQWLTNKIQEEHRQAIEEKSNQIKTLEFTNEKHQQKILGLNEAIDGLIKNRHVTRRRYFDNVLCFIKKNSKDAHP